MALFNSGSAGATPQPSPTSQKGEPMGLKEYDVEINGHMTTLQLSDEDAKVMGLKDSDATKEKPAPANKEAKAPANKGVKAPSARQAEAASQAFGAEKSQG